MRHPRLTRSHHQGRVAAWLLGATTLFLAPSLASLAHRNLAQRIAPICFHSIILANPRAPVLWQIFEHKVVEVLTIAHALARW